MDIPPSARRSLRLAATLVVLAMASLRADAQERPGALRPSPLGAEVAPSQAAPFIGDRLRLMTARPSAAPLARFAQLQRGGLFHESVTLPGTRAGETAMLHPISSPAFLPEASRTLETGFRLAMNQLTSVPGCRRLFERLSSEGPVLLATTVYVPATRAQLATCRHGALAFTLVGSDVTWICPSFARAGRRQAAMTLLHEALHYAGVGERPIDPAGLLPSQINAAVVGACAL